MESTIKQLSAVLQNVADARNGNVRIAKRIKYTHAKGTDVRLSCTDTPHLHQLHQFVGVVHMNDVFLMVTDKRFLTFIETEELGKKRRTFCRHRKRRKPCVKLARLRGVREYGCLPHTRKWVLQINNASEPVHNMNRARHDMIRRFRKRESVPSIVLCRNAAFEDAVHDGRNTVRQQLKNKILVVAQISMKTAFSKGLCGINRELELVHFIVMHEYLVSQNLERKILCHKTNSHFL